MKSFFKRFIKNQKGFEVVSTVALVALTLALARVIYTDVNIEVPEFTNGVGTTIGGIVTELENKGNGGGTIGCTHINSTVINTPGTCIQVGMQDKIVCLDCGFVVREGIPTGYGPHGKLNIVGAVSATCIKEGSTGDKICSLCQQVVEKATVIPATNHNYGDWIIVKDATCTAAGSRKKVCSTCSDTITETIKEKGHTPNPAVVENKVAATCTSVGSYDTVIYCSTCNDEISRTQTLEPMTPHTEEIRNKVDGYTGDTYCSVCGTKLADGKYIEYTITYNTDGGTLPATIVTKYTVLSETIKLPTPRKDKFIFEGWYETPDFRTPIVTEIAKGSTGDKVFYAKWEHDISQVPAILAPRDVWYKGTTPRNQITEINIVDKYTPVGTTIIKEQWDASDASSPNSVTAYVVGTKLILSGNGTGKIFANEDSSYAFSNPDKLNGFTNLKAINGANILDVSKVTNAYHMFDGCNKLQEIKVGPQVTSNVLSELPIQSATNIPGADGKWYSKTNNNGYAPVDIPVGVADTYYASKDLLPEIPKTYELAEGPVINGKIVSLTPLFSSVKTPPYGLADVQSVYFVDTPMPSRAREIPFVDADGDGGVVCWVEQIGGTEDRPIVNLYFSTQTQGQKVIANANSSYMFATRNDPESSIFNILEISLSNLDTSRVVSADGMFADCEQIQTIAIGEKVTSTVISEIPNPIDTNTGKTGLWRSRKTGNTHYQPNGSGLSPSIPVGVADTYVAVFGGHSGGTNGLPNKEEPGVMFSMFSNWKDRINSIFK